MKKKKFTGLSLKEELSVSLSPQTHEPLSNASFFFRTIDIWIVHISIALVLSVRDASDGMESKTDGESRGISARLDDPLVLRPRSA